MSTKLCELLKCIVPGTDKLIVQKSITQLQKESTEKIMFRKITLILTILLIIISGGFSSWLSAGYTVNTNSFQKDHSEIHHKLTVKIDPVNQSLDAVDEITLPAGSAQPVLYFLLNSSLTATSETPGITLKLEEANVKADNTGMDREDYSLISEISQSKYALYFEGINADDVVVKLKFNGKIHYPVKQLGAEYARGFSVSPGIIDERGVYLAGSTQWIPMFNDEHITFELTTILPESWSVVSQGTRTFDKIENGKRIISWNSPEPMEEVYLIAAEFHEYYMSAGATDVMAFLRTPDESLANKYLETTAQYLEMYRKLVGPYPFSKFALVENFWETGYGMPSFTLLGEQIIRFPFILHSSYPHELLHNYWGNSVYVDFKSGNWCEGLTAYMADQLIAEQRGQGDEYRRTTLQKFTDYVTLSNDFPLKEFISRYDPPSEAIGYGKTMMMWNMLREKVGDEQFVKGFQKFYRDNKFKTASFDDIRIAFESVTGKDLKLFFDQWTNRKGAPELNLSDVSVKRVDDGYNLQFNLKQVQDDDAFVLDVPIAVSFSDKVELKQFEMTSKEQTYKMVFPEHPLMIQVDPQFNVFRKLHYNEIPPSLSKIFGSEKLLIFLPSKADESRLEYYKELAGTWSTDPSKKIEVMFDNEITELPADVSAWIFGTENLFAPIITDAVKDYDAELTDNIVRFGKTSFETGKNSYVISVRHPKNPDAVLVMLSCDNKNAAQGLARKLPHYGKYSYLVFEGDEPTNIGKGEWETVNSPLSAKIKMIDGTEHAEITSTLPRRKALAALEPLFSSDRMMQVVEYLASEELAGRAPGTEGIDKAADFIAGQFEAAGLLPGTDDGTYFQTWEEVIDQEGNKAPVKNIIGIIPGTNPDIKDESVIVSAHYDHIGLGWPGASKQNIGKIHYGADDNASGVAVMLEYAHLLGKTLKPQRTIIFIAFTSEESGLLGSKYYVKNMKRFPAKKAISILNFDTVGRLGKNKLFVLNSSSAREWRFIFMGASYVTGIEAEMVTQDLDASDQRSFIEIGVPGVQFFTAPHEDYHKPTDTPDKIDADGLVKVATFGREAVLYLAEREEPLTFQGKVSGEEKKPQSTGTRRVTTGSMPDFSYSGEGVRIADLSSDSPAAKAGLQKGDVIIKLGSFNVTNLGSYSEALKNFNPGDVVDLVYLRDGNEYKTQIELIER